MRRVLILLVIVSIAVGGYYYYQPETVHRWMRDADLIETPEVTRVYKWSDSQGNPHITGKPPPVGTPYETLDYRSDENILPLPPQLQKDD